MEARSRLQVGSRHRIDDIGEDPDRWLVIGPDCAANLLEVSVLIVAEGDEVIIHAMPRSAVDRNLLDPSPSAPTDTKSGKPIEDELIDKLADEAEAGYEVYEIIAGPASAAARGTAPHRRRSTPSGSNPSSRSA